VRRLLLVVRRQVSLADIRLLLHPHQGVGRVLLLLLLGAAAAVADDDSAAAE